MEACGMKKLILICVAVAMMPLAGCVYRPYPYGSYYGDRGYGGYGDRYYGGYNRDGGYDRGYRDRYRDSDRGDYRGRSGYYDRD
jgi:hypothetical protein